MTDLRKAAKMAYEVMTDIHQVCEGANHKRKDMHPYGGDCPIQKRFDDAWEALRQALAESANSTTDFVESKALAQPEQEPVAWMDKDSGVVGRLHQWKNAIPLYIAPPKRKWVGLTDEEISEYLWMGKDVVSVIKEVQETLKEKNT